MKGLFRRCMTFIVASCVGMFVLSEAVAYPLINIFTDHASLFEMTLYGFRIFALSFLVVGVNIFASAFLRRCVMVWCLRAFRLRAPSSLKPGPYCCCLLPLI